MQTLQFLADSQFIEGLYSTGGIFIFRLLMVSLILFLALQSLTSIPLLQKFTSQQIGMMVAHLAVIGAAVSICFWLPSMRILHQTGFVASAEEFIWPDIILTGLAAARLTHFWHLMFRLLDKKTLG